MNPGPGELPKQPEFEAILEQSIEEGLRHILGQSGLEMVLNLYPLKRISADPVVLHEALKDIFMGSGAAIIEREVARRLLENVGNAKAEGRRRHSWLAAASNRRSSGGVSKREKQVLRQFLALESLARGGSRLKLGATPVELTAENFAYAFKKGT